MSDVRVAVTDESGVLVEFHRNTNDSTNYKVEISVDDGELLVLSMSSFIDAFMAIVPRGIWRGVDEAYGRG